MIEWTPENSAPPPPPPPANLFFAWLVIPSMWAMQPRDQVEAQAMRDFNVRLMEVNLARWNLEILERCQKCFGALIYREPGSMLSCGAAQVCDYFFARDRKESLVYTWLPRERQFRMVDQDWVDLRRFASDSLCSALEDLKLFSRNGDSFYKKI